jgi:cell division protein FtsW (lipid II flippase)
MTERHVHNPLQNSLQNPLVSEFLDSVCREVRAKEMHADIREELLGHLEDRVEQLVEAEGKSEKEAIAEAIKQMGNPVEIGESLHKVHRPKTDWGLLLLVGAIVIIAIVSLLLLHRTLLDSKWGNNLATVKAIIATIAIAIMFSIAFLNYRRLLHLSSLVYMLTVGLMFASLMFGPEVNGMKGWLFIGRIISFNVKDMIPYLLIIAAAGMIHRQKSLGSGKSFPADKKPVAEMMILFKELALFVLVPGFFFLEVYSLVPLLIYAMGLTILLAASGRFKLILALTGSLAVLTVKLVWFHDGRFRYIGERLTSFLYHDTDAGYATKQSINAISSAGLWGKGWGIPSESLALPYFYSEMLFPYLIHSLGWVFGAAIVSVVLLFVTRMIKTGMKLRDEYAKLLTIGLTGLFGVQFVWNFVMCLGFLPIMGFSLPLINLTSLSLFEFAVVGLLLSIFRRKDMMSSSLQGEQAV